jgi:hypothetical protein
MNLYALIVSFSVCSLVLQSCKLQNDLFEDDVYAMRSTSVDQELEAVNMNDSIGLNDQVFSPGHDFSVNEQLISEESFQWGTHYLSFYSYSGRYNYTYRWYVDYNGRITFLDQGFSTFDPVMSFYGWNGFRGFDQWNYLGVVPGFGLNFTGELGNYSPGSITNNGLYIRGPRGSISGMAGVTSRGASYKSSSVNSSQGNGRTPINPSQNNANIEQRPRPANERVSTSPRKEPIARVHRPNTRVNGSVNRGNSSANRTSVRPAGGETRGGNSSIRSNGRP